MGRYAIVETSMSIVVGVVIWDGIEFDPETGTGWSPIEGTAAVELSDDIIAGVGWSYTNGLFIPPSIPEPVPISISILAEAKRAEVRNACSDEITRSSFQSSALGAVHNYDCRLVDQINLKMRFDIAEASGSVEPLWASDGTRYQWKDHTAEEIMDVMVDMNEHIKTAQVKLASLMAAVDAATNKTQIDAIVW